MDGKEVSPAPLIWSKWLLWRMRLTRLAVVIAAMAIGSVLPGLWPQISLRIQAGTEQKAQAAGLSAARLAVPGSALDDPRLEETMAALPQMPVSPAPAARPAPRRMATAPSASVPGLTVHLADTEDEDHEPAGAKISAARVEDEGLLYVNQAIERDHQGDRAGALSLYLQALDKALDPQEDSWEDVRMRVTHLRQELESRPMLIDENIAQ